MKRILICEDEKDVQELLKDLLLKEGAEVYTALDGKEAIGNAKALKPDLILLDIRMPKINGLEVAKEIRKTDKAVKIIFLTGFQSPEIVKEAEKYGICDYIVKSSSTTDILQVIRRFI